MRGANETREKQPFQIPGATRRLVSMVLDAIEREAIKAPADAPPSELPSW